MFVRCCGDSTYKRFLTTILGDRLCEAFCEESRERDPASLLTTLTLEPHALTLHTRPSHANGVQALDCLRAARLALLRLHARHAQKIILGP